MSKEVETRVLERFTVEGCTPWPTTFTITQETTRSENYVGVSHVLQVRSGDAVMFAHLDGTAMLTLADAFERVKAEGVKPSRWSRAVREVVSGVELVEPRGTAGVNSRAGAEANAALVEWRSA